MRSELRYGRYIRVINDRGLTEEWYIKPSSDVAYIQNCVNVAPTYKDAFSLLSKVGMKSVYIPSMPDEYHI